MASTSSWDQHAYTFGLEEEYFLVRRNGRRLRHMPRLFFADCRDALGERFGSEMLQTQVEVQTGVHDDPQAAERDLRTLRRTVADIAHRHGLGILAAGTHPSAQWRGQRSTEKPHYDQVMGELQMLGQRNLLCGLHVHVQPADPAQRIALMARQQKISARRLKRKVGTRQQVIIDEVGPTVAKGRSKADAPQIDGAVYLSSRRPLKVGEIVTAKIEHSDQYDLHGSVAGF